MAIPLANVQTSDSFQTWLNTTNFLATYMSGSVVTVNSTFSSTTGNGAVVGSFGATTLFANTDLRGGNSSVAGTLTISTNTVISGTANVSGAANFTGLVNAASVSIANLSVTGTANVFGVAGFAGGINAASLSVTGPVSFTSTFTANTLSVSAGSVVVANAQGVTTTANVVIGAAGDLVLTPGAGIFANGSLGTAGQALLSNGTSTYWSTSVSNSAFALVANSSTFANQSVTNTFTVGTSGYFVSNGNLGIGTASPTNRLQVQGAILASDNITAYSDIRLKEDIETITNALVKVNSLRGVRYRKKDTNDFAIGVVAQEVIDIVPEVVQDNNEYLSVAYGNMVGLLIEAVKELTAKVEELESKVR